MLLLLVIIIFSCCCHCRHRHCPFIVRLSSLGTIQAIIIMHRIVSQRQGIPMHQQTTTTITTEDDEDNNAVLLLSIMCMLVESGGMVAIIICASVSLINCIRRPFNDDDDANGGR